MSESALAADVRRYVDELDGLRGELIAVAQERAQMVVRAGAVQRSRSFAAPDCPRDISLRGLARVADRVHDGD